MAARRRKIEPAALRTVDMFSRKTMLEEGEAMLAEEAADTRPSGPRDFAQEASETAIRWLGTDVFHQGDDVRVAVHPQGHAVLMLIRTHNGSPYGKSIHKLSKQQWAKLKKIASEDLETVLERISDPSSFDAPIAAAMARDALAKRRP